MFACERQDENHFSLTRLNHPPPKKMTKAQVRQAIKGSKMKFDMTSDELRAVTRDAERIARYFPKVHLLTPKK